MIRIQLPLAEVERLEELFRSTQDRKLRDRLQIVLMAHRGRPRQEIATDPGINRVSVTRWLNAWCERGLDGLRPRKAQGPTPGIPAAMGGEETAFRAASVRRDGAATAQIRAWVSSRRSRESRPRTDSVCHQAVACRNQALP